MTGIEPILRKLFVFYGYPGEDAGIIITQDTFIGIFSDGDKPVFCGSLDASDPSDWEETETNIWRYRHPTMGDVGNIIFTNGSDETILVLVCTLDLRETAE